MRKINTTNVHELQIGDYYLYKDNNYTRVYRIENKIGDSFERGNFYSKDGTFGFQRIVSIYSLIANDKIYFILNKKELNDYKKLLVFSS